MAISLNFFTDSSLTQPLGAALPIDREIGGPPVDIQLWLGSMATNRIFSPHVDAQIIISVLDSNLLTGWAASDITLALTQPSLDSNIPSTPLALAAQLTSGINGAVAFWLRFSGNSPTPKTASDIQLITNVVREYSQ